MKVVRYFKNNKLVEEKVGYSDEEPLTTKKIHYVDLPDGSLCGSSGWFTYG